MKKLILPLLTLLVIMSCKEEQKQNKKIIVNYPETPTVDTVTNYFGTDVKDPYRWLEDDRSEETMAWVKTQNKATYGYLDNIPFRNDLKERLTKLWNYEKIGSPFKEGDYTYFYKNSGLQNQYVIYRYKTDEAPETATVFLDPNGFSKDGTTSLGGLNFTSTKVSSIIVLLSVSIIKIFRQSLPPSEMA